MNKAELEQEFLRIIQLNSCPRCGAGSRQLEISPGHGPHAGQVRCSACNRHLKWLSKVQFWQIRLAAISFLRLAPDAAEYLAQDEINFDDEARPV